MKIKTQLSKNKIIKLKMLFFVALFASTAFFAYGSAGSSNADENKAGYCDKVAIYKSSGGKYGWPDFNGNFKQVCKGANWQE